MKRKNILVRIYEWIFGSARGDMAGDRDEKQDPRNVSGGAVVNGGTDRNDLPDTLKKSVIKDDSFIPEGIFYVGGNDVLPPPLSAEEERKLAARLSDNDREARSILIEHNLRLVVYISRRFENAGVSLEDLVSIGTIGLIKAVNTFDPDKNIKLATYGLCSTLWFFLNG